MARELLITADDFGVHDVIDNGIINCINTGSIDCVDTFVTHHSSKRRIRKLLNDHEEKFTNGSLKLGLHLSLTCGSPIYKSNKKYLKAISKKKTINNVKRQIFKHETGKAIICNIDDLETEYLDSLDKEIAAQFDKYIDITGKYPDHISCHAGVFHLTESLYNI